MDPAFVAFLDGNGVSQAEYLDYDGSTKLGWSTAFQNSKGNNISPHAYFIIPLLFNEKTNTMASIIYLFSDSPRGRLVIFLL
jgi:hypothetical protein